MTIYDCTIFCGYGAELDLLELRFSELENVVDKFIIVEATITHSGQPHEPILLGSVRFAKFSKWWSRVRYILVEDMPLETTPFGREYFQRNCILRGLIHSDPMDIALISDIDELPTASVIQYVANRLVQGVASFSQRLSYYHVNQICQEETWTGTKAVRMCEMTTPQQIRDLTDSQCAFVVSDAGWHFSYLGGTAGIQDKIKAYSHQEFNVPEIMDQKHIDDCAARGKDLFCRNYTYKTVPLNDTFPKYLVDNRERFAHLIA